MSITSIITLNQLISWFKDFQQNHFFLKDFGFGEPYDIGTSVQMEFPYMWVTMNEDSNIQTANNNRSAIPDISFSIMFMDKINNQQNYLDTNGFQSDNSQEILSDTLQCVQDLIVHIQQNFGQYGVFISQDVSFYPAVDETTDKATGVVARFVLRTRQVNCVLPESPGTIVVQPQQATIQTLLTCETLDECPTFQTYAYTGGTYNSGTTELTLTSLNGSNLVVSGITNGLGTNFGFELNKNLYHNLQLVADNIVQQGVFTNSIRLIPFVPQQTLTISELSIFCVSSGTSQIKIVCFDSNNGIPNDLIIESPIISANSVGNIIFLTTFTFVAGTTYFIGTYGNGGTSFFQAIDKLFLRPLGQAIVGSAPNITTIAGSATFPTTPTTFPSPIFTNTSAINIRFKFI